MNTVRCTTLLCLSVCIMMGAVAAAKEEAVPVSDVPAPVAKAVKARFPNAQVTGAAKEDEYGHLVYEMQLTEKSAKIDVTVNPQGTIEIIETQVQPGQLPKAVKQALAEKYPKSQVKLAETVVHVKQGKELLDCYELKLHADGKTTEVKFAADGTVKHVEEKSSADES